MSNPSITADKTPWYQWDTGLTVTVSGGEMTECHFANRKQGTAYVQSVINGVARVPDELLQVAAPIKAYGYVSDGAGGKTYVEETFEVIARNIPSDYTYTKTAQKTIRDAEAARDEAVQAAKDAKASELAADDSAVEASNSAQSAGESASAAATSASNAAKSAGDAAKSASDAKAAASKTVEDASELLKTYTDNAKNSADNAAASASNAADAASAASGSASAAKQSATDASDAKAAAQTAKAEAEAAKGEAAASASNAAASATAAVQSASDAAASVDAINVIAPKTVNVSASSSDQFDVAIGQNANTTANQSIAIGVTSTASHLASIALGSFSETSKDYELSLGRILENGIDSTREITHVSTPTADTSAATKGYVDSNTTNALIGKVSGKMLHVEDAWPGKPLGLTIDGAYKQDGTPSPESPVPITVIENPVLKVTGKNFWDKGVVVYDYSLDHLKYNANAAVTLSEGTYTISSDGRLPNMQFFEPGSHKQLTCAEATDMDGANIRYSIVWGGYGIAPATDESREITITLTRAVEMTGCVINAQGTWIQVEHGTKSTEYAPYVGTSLPITLPAEHPYLAALPDGTHDEIVIDKDGNVTLVARVGKSIIPETNINVSDELYKGYDGTSNRVVIFGTIIMMAYGKSLSGSCSMFVNGGDTQNRDTIRIGYYDRHVYLYTMNEDIIGDGSADAVNAWVREHQPVVTYILETPVTYSLGKLDIPSLPDTISNVLIEANLTPECAMTYKQDVNVVIAGLTAQINALKGTDDIVHDDNTASPDDAIDVLNNRDALDVTDHTIA